MHITPGKAQAFPGIYCKLEIVNRTIREEGLPFFIFKFNIFNFQFIIETVCCLKEEEDGGE